MPTIAELLLADTVEGFLTKLEAFGDHFEHLATTPQQRELAAGFNAFVREIAQEFIPQRDETDRPLAPGIERGGKS